MTADVQHLARTLTALGYHVTPLEHASKAATVRDWQNTVITSADVDRYFPDGRRFGLGLLLGTEVADGVYTIAFDVDLEDEALIARTRIAIGPNAVRKRGKKGVTVIARTEQPVASRVLKRKIDGKKVTAIDLLSSKHQTVLPPSLHPDTKEPYQWLGKPLQDVPPTELPIATKWTIDEVELAVTTPDSPFFAINEMAWNGPNGGGTVDDSVMHASAVLVQRGWPDEAIHRRISRAVQLCLHNSRHAKKWDDALFNKRLQNLIDDARRKGFDDPKKRKRPTRGEQRIQIVDQLISEMGGMDRLWRDLSALRRFEDGHWPVLDEMELQHRVAHMDTSWIEASDAEAIVRTVRLRAASRGRAPEPRICVKNGAVNVLTGDLEEWNSGHLLTAQLPFEYDAEAECPTYDAFVLHLFRASNDGKMRAPEEVKKHVWTFEEFVGLSLIEDTSFQRMLIVRGPPGSGKSTLLDVVRLLHDPKVISTVGLHKIHEERYVTALVGKLINLSAEIPADTMVQEETLKLLVSGDGVSIRKLFEEVIDNAKLPVRFIQMCNEMFKIRDSSGAVERRMMVLDTGPAIEEIRQDRTLPAKLAKEVPGVLNRALQGLRRLLERGRFDPPEDSRKAKDIFSEENNHVVTWYKERTHEGQLFQDSTYEMPKEESRLLSKDLYDDYREWVEGNGFKQLSAVTWGTRLTQMGYPVHVMKIAGRNQRIRKLRLLDNGVSGRY